MTTTVRDTIPCPPAPILDQYAEICRIANAAHAECLHVCLEAIDMFSNNAELAVLHGELEARYLERCGKGRAA